MLDNLQFRLSGNKHRTAALHINTDFMKPPALFQTHYQLYVGGILLYLMEDR